MIRIRVCTGMQCSLNGGGSPLARAIEDALSRAGILDQVEMFTAHCLGECDSGPCVRVGGERFYNMHPEDAVSFVREEVLPRIGKEA